MGPGSRLRLGVGRITGVVKTGDVIEKPWGHERIIELNDAYCIKHLVIRPGHRLSKQYHERKRETLLLLSGGATVTLFDDGSSRDVPLTLGESQPIAPGVVHRIAGPSHGADAVILEVSSPEVEDVVRLSDDYGR